MEHKVLKKQTSSDFCMVCGIKNEYGLQGNFYEVDGGEVVCLVKTRFEHQSYPGRTHGGIISALLDETIGRAINITEQETFGVTASLDVKFRKPVPLGEEIKVVGRIVKSNKRMFEGTGEIIDKQGNVLASASGIYAKMPITSIANGNKDELTGMMFMNYLDEEPTTIDY